VAGLSLAGVGKSYGSVRALRGLDLDVADGELMVLVGPSGCGKTTTLRVVSGLEAATEGRVRIGDRDVTALPPDERNVSMVFQTYALFPHMTVARNVGFGLAARGLPREERRRRVEEAAALVGCGALLDRRPFQLSGGERQRVALARALVREPDAFLLDEPLSNLDAQLRTHMRAELKRLQRRLATTALYVTHDQVEALTLGDRVAVLREGALQQVGTPDEVYRRPANRFVARFIGSPAMNVLPAEVVGGEIRAGPFARQAPGSIELRDRVLELGVRPEHVEVAGDGSPARVELVEVVGGDAYLHLAAGEARFLARVGPGVRPSPGTEVRIAARPEDLYVFDADSEVTLVQGG
jgi:ABC-type sugar transport system ATPase subunit